MRISDWSSDVCSSDLCPALSAITFALLRLTTLLVVVDFLEVGIDDAVLALGATALAGRGGVTAGRAVTGLALLIERLADLHGDLLQGLRLGLDGLEVVALGRRLQCRDGLLGGGFVGCRNLLAGFRHGLLELGRATV